MQDILEFLKRPDFWLELIGAVSVGLLAYHERIPVWSIFIVVLLGQAAGLIAMKKKKNG